MKLANRMTTTGIGIALLFALLPVPVTGAEADLEVRKLDRLPAGTEIQNKVPEGWTHVILKTRSKLTSGDIDQLNGQASSLVELFFTGILARVVRSQTGVHSLDSVAVGMGTKCNGVDRIITPSTYERLGAGFNLLQGYVFERSEQELDRMIHVASTPSTLVFDVPNVMLIDNRHKDIVMRVVALVDPPTGRFACALWRIIPQPNKQPAIIDKAIWMRPGQVETCPLHVDGNELTLGIPSPRAFAAERLPDGTQLQLSEQLKQVGILRTLTPETLAVLDAELRQMLGFAR